MNSGREPAFPVHDSFNETTVSGLTKREWLAGMALQGLLTQTTEPFKEDGTEHTEAQTMQDNYRIGAKHACAYADALIAELNKP